MLYFFRGICIVGCKSNYDNLMILSSMNQIILWYSIFLLYIQTYYIAIHLKSVPSITSTPRLIFEILQNTRKTIRKRSSFQLFMKSWLCPANNSLFCFNHIFCKIFWWDPFWCRFSLYLRHVSWTELALLILDHCHIILCQ